MFFSVSNALTNPKLAAPKTYFQTICLRLKHYNLFLQGLQDRCDALFDPIPFMTNDIRITSPSNTLKPGNQYSIPLLIDNNQSRRRLSDAENERHTQTFRSRDTTSLSLTKYHLTPGMTSYAIHLRYQLKSEVPAVLILLILRFSFHRNQTLRQNQWHFLGVQLYPVGFQDRFPSYFCAFWWWNDDFSLKLSYKIV